MICLLPTSTSPCALVCCEGYRGRASEAGGQQGQGRREQDVPAWHPGPDWRVADTQRVLTEQTELAFLSFAETDCQRAKGRVRAAVRAGPGRKRLGPDQQEGHRVSPR